VTKYLIIGGGVTGVTAAQAILPLDAAAEVTILSADPYPYYYRPRLWEYIAGQIDRSALFFRQMEWYQAQKITLRCGTNVTAVDPAMHHVTIAGGDPVPFDRLLLACGARAFLPRLPGATLTGVFSLRTLEDAEAIRQYSADVRQAVVVGGGLLGLETARAIASTGLDVTVLETAPHLLPRQLDFEGAQVLQASLETSGLRIVTGAEPVAISGESKAVGVELPEGRRLPGGLIVFSVGIRSECALAQAAGLTTSRGIQVDDHMRTSHPDIFAAGDAAEHAGIVYGLIQPGIEQARVAAANMAGGAAEYHGSVPAASLKIVGVEMASLGEALGETDRFTVLRRNYAAETGYRKLVLRKDGSLAGAILINQKEYVLPIKQLMASRQDVSKFADQLLNRDFDFLALSKGNLPEPGSSMGVAGKME